MKYGLLLATLACCILATWSCEPDQYKNGCKIFGNTCECNRGCPSEYIYKSRRACYIALRALASSTTPTPERVTNICYNMPCSRGICIQTSYDPGFTCRCEGTGYYGQRCEKACATVSVGYGNKFPHECVVI